ncbi:uncharacterized protein N7498_001676, partial [Penicillium cinerascens]
TKLYQKAKGSTVCRRRTEPQPRGPDSNQNTFQTVPSPLATSNPTAPTLPSKRTAPHRNVKPLFRISTTYSTIAARAISFQRQLLTGITPHQLAQNGLYHQVRAGVSDTACCFTCEAVVPLMPSRKTQNTQRRLLMASYCHDLKLFIPSPLLHSHTPFSANPSGQISAAESSSRPNPTIVNQAEHDLRLLTAASTATSHRSSITYPTHPEDHISHVSKQTYASVLQQPTTSLPPPTTRPQLTPLNPPVTIEELRRRFHNKPSPFELEKRKTKRQKTTSVAQSLSRFVNSA